MENYQIIIVAVVMFAPITLILSTLHHIKVEKEKIIKQKFEIVSLIFHFLFNTLEVGFALFLFFFSFKIFGSINNKNYKLDLLLFLLGIIILLFSYGFLKASIYFFKHLYYEASRNVYFERETGKIIVNKNNIENNIDLNYPNIKIIKFSNIYGKLPTFGKIEIYDGENKIVLSELLDLSPELDEKINKVKNIQIIDKNLNWI